MRLIILLAALLIVGLLVYRQVGTNNQFKMEEPVASSVDIAPQVPVNPQDLQKFGQDMKQYLNDTAAEQARKIDQQTQ